MNIEKSKGGIVLVIAIAIILVYAAQDKTAIDSAGSQSDLNLISGQWDISSQVNSMGYGKYLIEELDFDYSDEGIQNLAREIKQSTSSPEQAIKETIKYVAQNIKYSSKITVQYCYDERASTVLQTGSGDCVSMSRITTALLRAQGIPARTMGGCLSFKTRCSILFSTVPYQDAQVTELSEGDFKKRGFLHEWVEAWTPSQGFFLIEATSGQTFPLSCLGSTYLKYSYDDNQYNRCVINSPSFWETCRGF